MGRRRSCLEVLVHVLGADATSHHNYLRPVDELREFLGEFLIRLILRSEPHFASFLNNLFAQGMDPGIKGGYSAGIGGPILLAVEELFIQRFKIFHNRSFFHRAAAGVC